jgi:hypothetical protein
MSIASAVVLSFITGKELTVIIYPLFFEREKYLLKCDRQGPKEFVKKETKVLLNSKRCLSAYPYRKTVM